MVLVQARHQTEGADHPANWEMHGLTNGGRKKQKAWCNSTRLWAPQG
jgi:hypothetical protein